MEKKIAVILGDGIGPEVTQQSIKVLDTIAKHFYEQGKADAIKEKIIYLLDFTQIYYIYNFLCIVIYIYKLKIRKKKI